jgi:hypothetical protein
MARNAGCVRWRAGCNRAKGRRAAPALAAMPLDHTSSHPFTNRATDDGHRRDFLPEPLREALFRAVLDAGADVARLRRELSPYRTLAYRDSLPPGLVGAYVPITGVATGFHIGVLADVCSCDRLTCALNRAHEPIQPGVRAALSELALELALGVSQRVDPALRLAPGAPLFVDGLVRRTRRVRLRAAEVAFGSIDATLALVSLEALRETDWPGRNEPPSRPEP